MADQSALFACTKCNARHPFEELSQSEQLCKECRNNYPVVKCTYCRAEFQQGKGSTNTICRKCAQNVKAYGKPTACEYCNVIAAFIGNRCQRCTNSEKKWGSPLTCEQCKQKCAFDRSDESTRKVDGKILCWLCTLTYRRVLAKTRKHQEDSIKNYGNFSESAGSSSRPITIEGGSSSSSERNTDSERQKDGEKVGGSSENRSASVEKGVKSGDKHSSTSDKHSTKEKHSRSGSSERPHHHHHHHHRHGSSSSSHGQEKGKDHHKSHKSKSHHTSNHKHDKSHHEHSASKKPKLETTTTTITTPGTKTTSTNGVTPTKSTSLSTTIASLSDKSFSDPNSTDHMIAITQLREELEALKKQLQGKDQQMKEKEKKITELKAFQYESEKEFRTKITNLQKHHSDAIETLQGKNRDLMKQVAILSKGNKNKTVNSPSV